MPERPLSLRTLAGVEAFNASCGFAGGTALLLDPSGALLRMSPGMFPGLPVSDFFLVGLWLFVVFGVGSSLVAYLVWTKHGLAASLALLEATIWIGWISYEMMLWATRMAMFITPWFVPSFVVIALLLSPSVRLELRGIARR